MAKKSTFDIALLVRLLTYLKGHKTVFLSIAVTVALIAVLSTLRPYLVIEMINRFVVQGGAPTSDALSAFIQLFQPDDHPQQQLLAWTIFILILLLLQGIVTFFSTYLGALLGQSIIQQMRVKLYKHLHSFRLSYFDRTPNGVVVTRMISDIEAVSEVFSTGFITIVGDGLKLVFIVVAMTWVNWKLTLLTLVPIPLLIVATRIFARAMKKSFQKERLKVTQLNTFVQEHLSGMTIIQLFNRSSREYGLFKTINADHRQAHLDAIWAYSIFFPLVELLSSLSIAAVIFWSLMQLGGDATLLKTAFGVVFGFILWIYQLYRPIRQMADRFNILQRGMVRAERVFELLDRQEHIDTSGTQTEVDFSQTIAFREVWFAYTGDQWVLKGINFEAPAGKSVALVGTTGAGKSTIVNLLTRFYDYQKGAIAIGDHAIRDIELSTLRSNIALVLQEVFLFSDTIKNNITLGDERIGMAQIVAAAKKVGAHDFIVKLPRGYDYNVRERGGVLSTGQKQLISFIRAYVYNPKILILDEATASVDSESEELIQRATRELQRGRTSIVIAHRLSTIVHSDEILVIDDGTIRERGTHEQLLEKNGHYKKLYDLNFS